jgi:hypothetical protein
MRMLADYFERHPEALLKMSGDIAAAIRAEAAAKS